MKNKLLYLLFAGNLTLINPLFNNIKINFINPEIIIAQNYQKKRISSSNRQYLVSYDGNRFYFEDLNGNKIIPNNPENRNLLMDLANCYLTDEKVKSIGVNKLSSDVANLEFLVAKAAGYNISSVSSVIWDNKTDPIKLLTSVFTIGDNFEIDPKLYVSILAGNINSNLGKKQKEAVSLITNNLDSFFYGRVRMLLEDSEPYIEPSYFLLRDALNSNNYKLDKLEKDRLLKLDPSARRQEIIIKIKSTPEFARFLNDVSMRQANWKKLREKASSVVYY